MSKKEPLQNAEAVEALHPGFFAIAGPYGAYLKDKASRISERASCVRSLRDQKKACPHAKIIRHGSKAWIVRKKPLELDNGKRNKELVSSNLGIYALGMRSA